MTHLIVAKFIYPPIPTRDFDWVAYYDADEPNDNGQMACGYGTTEQAAVLDLITEHPRPDVFCCERPIEERSAA